MSKEINCWEYQKCSKANMAKCPVPEFKISDGFCGGINGGRACTYITGTFCLAVVPGAVKMQNKDCANCLFYKMLAREHGGEFSVSHFSQYVREKGVSFQKPQLKKDS